MRSRTAAIILTVIACLSAVSCASRAPYRETLARGGEPDAPRFSGAFPPAEVRILVLSDIHGYAASALVKSAATRARHMIFWGKHSDDDYASTSAILEAAAAGGAADLAVLPGDLTVDGEEESHALLAGILGGFERSGIGAYVTVGNHDLRDPYAVKHGKLLSTETLTVGPARFESIYAAFGYSEALSLDTDSLSYAAEPIPGLALIVLDTGRWRENRPYPIPLAAEGGELSGRTLAWLGLVLASAREAGARAIVVQHHSPYLPGKRSFPGAAEELELCGRFGVELVIAGHRHASMDLESGGTRIVVAPSVAAKASNALLIELGSEGARVLRDPFGFDGPDSSGDVE